MSSIIHKLFWFRPKFESEISMAKHKKKKEHRQKSVIEKDIIEDFKKSAEKSENKEKKFMRKIIIPP